MIEGFVGRVQRVGKGVTIYGEGASSEFFPHRVWVQPLVEGEPEPGEVWVDRSGRHVTITNPPHLSNWSGDRLVQTDRGLFSVQDLMVYPWHRRADGSGKYASSEPRMRRDRRGDDYRVTTRHFRERGKCDRKGERRQDDE